MIGYDEVVVSFLAQKSPCTSGNCARGLLVLFVKFAVLNQKLNRFNKKASTITFTDHRTESHSLRCLFPQGYMNV